MLVLVKKSIAPPSRGFTIRAPTHTQQWPTQQIDIPRTSPVLTTWTISASTVTCAVKLRTTTSSAMTTAVILMSSSSLKAMKERALCEEALAGCPVEAIGRDGE